MLPSAEANLVIGNKLGSMDAEDVLTVPVIQAGRLQQLTMSPPL